ncbi:MAG: hypothetical protein HYS74_01480 [Parcubacteria group bacterium]|nr:hypothetical protein [Parcubacteria group bacterium]
MLISLVSFSPERGEWSAVIVRHDDDGDEIVCIGCEESEAAARRFVEQALAYHNGESAEHPKDMYDRTSVALH